MKLGLYEQLINNLIASRLSALDEEQFFIGTSPLDKAEAARVISLYLSEVIRTSLDLITGEEALEKQLAVANKIILLLSEEIGELDFRSNLIDVEGKILNAVFKRLDAGIANFELHLKQITPYTRLSTSELFTGSNVGISLESEIKKEIASADHISFLVSFIKWTGIRIFEKELEEFTRRGGTLRIITTSYLGATDYRAVEYLSKLPNTEVKVSYNTENERLHAKAYLFGRETGFHTGYIGSSNLSTFRSY